MHGGRSFGISRSIESVTPLSLIIILQPIHLDWQKQNISPTSPSSPQPAQSRSANQAPAQLPAPSLTISGTASVALTLRRPKSESLSWFHSYLKPSHIKGIACCARVVIGLCSPFHRRVADVLTDWEWCGEESLRSSIPRLIGRRPSGPRLPSADPLGLQVQDAPAT